MLVVKYSHQSISFNPPSNGTLCGSRLPVCSYRQERNPPCLIGTVRSVHHPICLSRVRVQTPCHCHSRRQIHSRSPTSNSPIVQEVIAKRTAERATSISQFQSKSVASATVVAVTASKSGFAAGAAYEVGAAEYVVLYGSRELIEPIGGQPHSGSTNGDQELDKHSEGLKRPLKLRNGGLLGRLKADSTNRKRGESLAYQ